MKYKATRYYARKRACCNITVEASSEEEALERAKEIFFKSGSKNDKITIRQEMTWLTSEELARSAEVAIAFEEKAILDGYQPYCIAGRGGKKK